MEGYSKLDFHCLPFEGKLLFLAAYLDLKVGGSYPRYDFERSNPVAGEYVFVSHHGPADPGRWQEDLPLVDRYLGGRWKVEPLDGTSLVLSKLPELPALIPFTQDLLRKGEVLLGFDQMTGAPYYVPLTKLTHVLVGGQSCVGKSVLLNQCLRSLLANLDVIDELVLVDLKGGVELSRYKALSPKIRFIKHYDELPELAERLVATMYERLDELEKRGELAVKSGFRIVIIDEFAAIQQRTFKSKDEKERHQTLLANLNLLSQQARAAGIKLWAQLQKPTADNMDTNFRTNLQSVLCFFMPSKLNAASMFGELDGLPADPTKLGKGEFVFRDDGQNRTVLLKAAYCDEHDIEGLKACVHPDYRMPDEPTWERT
jgi:DNA segregation ATPase FtsK/SpoIIIE-like protein